MYAQWRYAWDGSVLGNLSKFPRSAWSVIGSSSYSLDVDSSYIKATATAEDGGSYIYAWVPVDVTNCSTLHVYATAINYEYFCRGDVWLQETAPSTSNLQALSDTWNSGSHANGWKTIDVSSLSGTYYLVIAKEHWNGCLNITSLYFDMIN